MIPDISDIGDFFMELTRELSIISIWPERPIML